LEEEMTNKGGVQSSMGARMAKLAQLQKKQEKKKQKKNTF